MASDVGVLPCSRSALDKLGQRLALPGSISEKDRELLADVLAVYDDVLAHTERRVRRVIERFSGEEGVTVTLTTRVKTTSTIREKLRRERGMALKGMQDIAGMRLTGDMRRTQQDRLGQHLVAEFAAEQREPSWVDRRKKPSFGYRALHVIVYLQRIPVEVQVRTAGQNSWAQVVEKLGDIWGRGLRYGEAPIEPNKEAVGDVTRSRFLAAVMNWGEQLDWLEESVRDEEELQAELHELEQEMNDALDAYDAEDRDDLIGRVRELQENAQSRRVASEREQTELQQLLARLESWVEERE